MIIVPRKLKHYLLKLGLNITSKINLLTIAIIQLDLHLITNSGNKIREALGTQIKQDLALIGIEVDFTPIAFSLLIDRDQQFTPMG